MGKVFRGKYLMKEVAIKEYSNFNIYENFENKSLLTFLSELINTLFINFPHVNKCYGVSINEKEGFVYTVHELGECSLKKKLKEGLTMKKKHGITKNILEIMMFLQIKNIVHRDLKPDNFLITKFWEVQICDFGTIRTIKNAITHSMNSTFTVKYAPPEFINGQELLSLSSDVWSLGIIFYDIYYGENLWKDFKDQNEIIVKMNQKNIPKIEYRNDVPKEITKVIQKMLVFEMKDRITVKEIIDSLNELLFSDI